MPLRLLCALAVALGGGGCALPSGCPQTVEAARTADLGEDMFIGGGYVIRFISSPDPQYRGYDVNITTPISPTGFLNTVFLRVVAEIPEIEPGDPVLLVGPRERGALVAPGGCPPLTVIDEKELDADG